MQVLTRDKCGNCGADLRDPPGTRRIAIVDRDLDCVIAHKCPDCGYRERVTLGEVLVMADPAVFPEKD